MEDHPPHPRTRCGSWSCWPHSARKHVSGLAADPTGYVTVDRCEPGRQHDLCRLHELCHPAANNWWTVHRRSNGRPRPPCDRRTLHGRDRSKPEPYYGLSLTAERLTSPQYACGHGRTPRPMEPRESQVLSHGGPGRNRVDERNAARDLLYPAMSCAMLRHRAGSRYRKARDWVSASPQNHVISQTHIEWYCVQLPLSISHAAARYRLARAAIAFMIAPVVAPILMAR